MKCEIKSIESYDGEELLSLLKHMRPYERKQLVFAGPLFASEVDEHIDDNFDGMTASNLHDMPLSSKTAIMKEVALEVAIRSTEDPIGSPFKVIDEKLQEIANAAENK